MSKRFMKSYNVFQKIKLFWMFISGLTILTMMLYISADVFLRYFYGKSGLTSYEFSQYYFMPLAVFPGLAYAVGLGMMPRIDIFIQKVKEKYQRMVSFIVLTSEILVFFLLTYFGLRYALYAMNTSQSFPAGGKDFILAPAIFFVPLGFLLVLIEFIFLLIKNIKDNKPTFTVIDEDNN